jgi:pimeloyl-ACP methyl ester carboxylesterase
MAEDVFELMQDRDITRPVVIGHSLGGKVAMQVAAMHQEKISGLVVSDIAVKKYPVVHSTIISALNAVKIETLASRNEAEQILSQKINDTATLQFILKNIYWQETATGKVLSWRFNLEVISRKIENTGEEIHFPEVMNLPALLVRGDRSDYVSERDISEFKKIFPFSEAITIKNSGHWIHAEQPEEFFKEVIAFLDRISFL